MFFIFRQYLAQTSLCLILLFFSTAFAAPTPNNTHPLLNIDQAENTTEEAATLTNVSVSTADAIRYMQLFFYDNTSGSNCSGNLLGVASIADNNLGQSLTAGTHKISLPGTSAYSLATATNVGVNPSDVKCMQLYLSGNPGSTNSTNCQAFTDESCSSSSCVSTQSYDGSWSSSNSACRVPFFYVTGTATGRASNISLYLCTNTSGTFSCSATGPGASTFSKGGLGNVANDGYGYFISNPNLIGSKALYQCPITASTGSVSSSGCTTQTTFASSLLTSPRGLAISNNYLYLYDQAGGGATIYSCSLSNGLVSSCTSNLLDGSLSITSGEDMTINNGYLYLANSGGTPGIYECAVSGDSVSSCGLDSAASVSTPKGITVYNNKLYYVNSSPASVTECNIDSTNGTLSGCQSAGATGLSNPSGISIYSGVAYIINTPLTNTSSISITQCAIDGSGTFSTCSTQAASLGSTAVPVGISYF